MEQHPLEKLTLTLEGKHLATQLLTWMNKTLKADQCVTVFQIRERGPIVFRHVQAVRHALDICCWLGWSEKLLTDQDLCLTRISKWRTLSQSIWR